MQANHPIKTLLFAVAIAVNLYGCASNQTVEPAPTHRADPEIALAKNALNREDYPQAAIHYLSLAGRSSGSAQSLYQLLAAENQFRAEAYVDSETSLNLIAPNTLTGDNNFKFRLLSAELELQKRQIPSALVFLEATPPENTPAILLRRLYRDRVLAYGLAGDIMSQTLAMRLLDPLLTDPQQQRDNQLDILRGVIMVGPLFDRDPNAMGWNALANIAATAGDEYYPRYLEWRPLFPTHPAQNDLLRYYSEEQARLQVQTDRIAIFLPNSGRYAGAATAIRDGILSHWNQLPADSRPLLKFYDTADTMQIWPTYQRAIDDGAQVIIGPLQKDAVIQLARAGELAVPVLALNQVDIDTIPPENLYQYALHPEGEAQQIAQYALEAGHSNALVLYPDNEWGQRIAQAFTESLEGLGGRVPHSQPYKPAGPDYSASIKAALLLDESEARHSDMQRILGKKLKFTPRRRTDIDYIFLIAKPRQARQIRPQLQFFYAADLPVHSTSQAWNGSLNRQQALDVAGIQLPDIPWFLIDNPEDPLALEQFSQLFPDSKSSLGRLYAMGMDSFTLLPHLRRLQRSEMESLDGRTGNLYIDRNRRVQRLLVWTELGEHPKVLGYSTRPGISSMLPTIDEPPKDDAEQP